MVRFSDVDFSKARVLRKYLGRATLKLVQRDVARQELADQLQKIKKIASKHIEQDLVALESKISQVISKERNIIRHIKEEDMFHAQLREKIHRLDEKLDKYLRSSDQRTIRIKEIEQKVKEHFKTKKQKIKELNEDIKLLDKLQKEIQKEGKGISRLTMVQGRLKELQVRLRNLEQ